MERELKAGQHVVYTDPVGKKHDAIVTIWHAGGEWIDDKHVPFETLMNYRRVYGEQSVPCLNLVYASKDAMKRDDYGQQLERATSISHKSVMGPCHGNYFEFPDEVK